VRNLRPAFIALLIGCAAIAAFFAPAEAHHRPWHPKRSPSPSPISKSLAKGIFTRSGIPPAGTPVRVATVPVSWSVLEANRDQMTLDPIESALDTAQSRDLDGVRLRVFAGRHAPAWAKDIGDGPIGYVEPQNGQTGAIPDVWDPAYQAEVAELFAAICGSYDADPRLRLLFASGAMTWYAEPFIRGIASPENRQALLAAGYTKEADAAAQRWQLDIMAPCTQTPIGLAYNPWQFVNADGTGGSSVAFMAEVMDHHIASFGERTVLQNNSIRSSFIGSPPPMYAEFRARLLAPGTTQYQTAAAVRIGDAAATMDWAIDYLQASGVELVDNYAAVHTDAELADYDRRLRAL
jgi:hypothetical protein